MAFRQRLLRQIPSFKLSASVFVVLWLVVFGFIAMAFFPLVMFVDLFEHYARLLLFFVGSLVMAFALPKHLFYDRRKARLALGCAAMILFVLWTYVGIIGRPRTGWIYNAAYFGHDRIVRMITDENNSEHVKAIEDAQKRRAEDLTPR